MKRNIRLLLTTGGYVRRGGHVAGSHPDHLLTTLNSMHITSAWTYIQKCER